MEGLCSRIEQCLVSALLKTKDISDVTTELAAVFGVDVAFTIASPLESLDAAHIIWLCSGSYTLFTLSGKILSHPFMPVLAKHLANSLPLFLDYARCEHRVSGTVKVSLEDIGVSHGLGYCDHRPEVFLVPDPIFLGTEGYKRLRKEIEANAVPWRQRKRAVFWRGSTTGWYSTWGSWAEHWSELPRVALVRLAREAKDGSSFDVGLTAVTPRHFRAEADLFANGLMREFVPPATLAQYQLHIDIDGNTNAWMSLYSKLLSGSPVLKVQSSVGFRQWYYDRLKPWVNFVPISASMQDLEELVGYLLSNPELAFRIGEEGRRLAMSMTVDGEIQRARTTIASAFTSAWSEPPSGPTPSQSKVETNWRDSRAVGS